MARFSIVIPVYNSYEYLPRCVGSVLDQTYGDLEVILVDDGSTDVRTPELLERLAAEDPRVKVIHQANAGTSAARNTAVAAATGDYVTFLDNDDWWRTKDALAQVVQVLDTYDPDVVMHMPQVFREDEDRFVERSIPKIASKVNGKDRAEALDAIIGAGAMQRAVWTKVVRRSLIEDHGLRFPEGKRNEDTEWTAQLIACAGSYGWVDGSFYAYRKGTGVAQTSKPVTKPMVDGLGEIVAHYGELYGTMAEKDPAYGRACEAYLAYPLMVWMGQAADLKILGEKEPYGRLKALAPAILGPDIDPQVHLAALAWRLLGFRLTCALLGIAYGKTR